MIGVERVLGEGVELSYIPVEVERFAVLGKKITRKKGLLRVLHAHGI